MLETTEGQKNLPRYFAQVFEMTKKMNSGRLDFELPDGRVFRANGKQPGPVSQLKIHNADVFARLIREGDLGFCDAYLDGWWSTPDLQAFLDLIHADNDEMYDSFPGMGMVRAWEKFRFWLQSNSKSQAKKNISYHYDLGNDFYKLWLDDTMTYSSAIFETGQESTEKAQLAKYGSLIDQMGAKKGDHILEIGCGWGGFAEFAAKERGLKVTGLTISKEQLKYAEKRISDAGLTDMVNFKLQDYRDERGKYDGIASIEMFEAVGEKYWPAYFQCVKNCLYPGKQATLQIITIQEARWEIYRRGVDFIQKYIFPGGMLPSPSTLEQIAEKNKFNFSIKNQMADSYHRTLETWRENFNKKWSEIKSLGYSDEFRRMWNFYLSYCSGGFKAKTIDVYQIDFSKK